MTLGNPLKTIQKDGNIWLCLGDQILMYIEKKGTLHVPGDIIAYSKIPPIPYYQLHEKDDNQQS